MRAYSLTAATTGSSSLMMMTMSSNHNKRSTTAERRTKSCMLGQPAHHCNNKRPSRRRESKILLEGIEYDLSNLLTQESLRAGDKLNASNDSLDTVATTGTASSIGSGYYVCYGDGCDGAYGGDGGATRSSRYGGATKSTSSLPVMGGREAGGSGGRSGYGRQFTTKSISCRGDMKGCCASASPEETERTLRRFSSPYRFDVEAMRMLMKTSLRDLNESIRSLSTGGGGSSSSSSRRSLRNSWGSSRRRRCKGESKEEEEEEDLGLFASFHDDSQEDTQEVTQEDSHEGEDDEMVPTTASARATLTVSVSSTYGGGASVEPSRRASQLAKDTSASSAPHGGLVAAVVYDHDQQETITDGGDTYGDIYHYNREHQQQHQPEQDYRQKNPHCLLGDSSHQQQQPEQDHRRRRSLQHCLSEHDSSPHQLLPEEDPDYYHQQYDNNLDSSYYYDAMMMSDETQYHEACQTRQEQDHRYYTLEQMSNSAMNNDGEFDDEEHEMEIAPGHYMQLRGAKETWRAVANNQIAELQCLDCCVDLVCIQDCEYTVCPDCRVVNPVSCYGGGTGGVNQPHGVGMGLKKEWVLKKQYEQQQQQQKLRLRQRQRQYQFQQQQHQKQQQQQQQAKKAQQQSQELIKEEPRSLFASSQKRNGGGHHRRRSLVDPAQAQAQVEASSAYNNKMHNNPTKTGTGTFGGLPTTSLSSGGGGGTSTTRQRLRRGAAIQQYLNSSQHLNY